MNTPSIPSAGKQLFAIASLSMAIAAAFFSACADSHTCLRQSDCASSMACVVGSCTTVVGTSEGGATDAGSIFDNDANVQAQQSGNVDAAGVDAGSDDDGSFEEMSDSDAGYEAGEAGAD